MIKYIKPLLIPFSAAVMFSGCDSTTPLNTLSDDIEVSFDTRGIDMEAAEADPTGIAKMPKFLLSSDKLEHGNIASLDIRQLTQLDDGVINSAGQLRIDYITLTWKRSENTPELAVFTVSSQNAWPFTDEERQEYFTGIMDSIIAAAGGSSNSINQALNNVLDSSTPKVLTDAASSAGLVTAIGPEPWPVPGALQPYVLMERSIIYTVTSTNQQLIDDGIISGTFLFSDTWGYPAFLSEEDEGEEPKYDQVVLEEISEGKLLTLVDEEAGTFTITINN